MSDFDDDDDDNSEGQMHGEHTEEEMTTAVQVFAHYLGVELDGEFGRSLLRVAEECFYDLPPGWEIGIGEDEHAGIPYFFNSESGESDWKHPKEDYCRRRIKNARINFQQQKAERQQRRQEQLAKAQQEYPDEADEEGDDDLDQSGDSADDQDDEEGSEQEVTNARKGYNRENREGRGHGTADFGRPRGSSPSSGQNDAAEVVEVEDFDDASDAPDPPKIQQQDKKTTESAAGRGSTGFGMSPDDFLDDASDADASASAGGKQYSSVGVNSKSNLSAARRCDNDDHGKSNYDSNQFQNNATKAQSNVSPKSQGRRDNGWSSGTTARSEMERSKGGGRGGGRGAGPSAHRNDYDRNGRSGRGSGGSALSVSFRDEFDRLGGKESQQRNRYRDSGRESSRERENRDSSYNASRSNFGGADASRERNIDRELRDREREREYQEREKEREFRERERQRDMKELERDHDRELSAREKEKQFQRQIDKLEESLRKANDHNSELAEKLDAQRHKMSSEISELKEDLGRAEERLVEERRDRKAVEAKVTELQVEQMNRVREAEEKGDIRAREAARKARAETEEEFREKLRLADRRAVEDTDELRLDLTALKRKNEEAQRELDNARRKVALSRTDGRLEVQQEVDQMRSSLRDQEERERQLQLENRRSKEELAAIQGKLAAALQAKQVAEAEIEAIRNTSSNAVQDAQINSGALQSATLRIQQLDAECAQLKAENTIIRKDKESLALEVRKLQGANSFSGDRLTMTESEVRRMKAQSQAEVGRLTSRITEVETMNNVLRSQLDEAANSQTSVQNNLRRELDVAEAEVARLKERESDRQMREESMQSRLKSQERELIKVQEDLFRKERQIKEEQQRLENVQASIADIRRDFEAELTESNSTAQKLQAQLDEEVGKHKREVAKMNEEVARKVPSLIAAAVEKVELHWNNKHNNELSDLKRMLEMQMERLKAAAKDEHARFSESEAKTRVVMAEDKAEIERLRKNGRKLKAQNEELEDVIVQLRRELRLNHSAWDSTSDRRGYHNRSAVAESHSFENGPYDHRLHQRQQQPMSMSVDHGLISLSNMLQYPEQHQSNANNFAYNNSVNQMPQQARPDQQQQLWRSFDGGMLPHSTGNTVGNVAGREQSAIAEHTMSFLSEQLHQMKRQVASALQPKPRRARNQEQQAQSLIVGRTVDDATGMMRFERMIENIHNDSNITNTTVRAPDEDVDDSAQFRHADASIEMADHKFSNGQQPQLNNSMESSVLQSISQLPMQHEDESIAATSSLQQSHNHVTHRNEHVKFSPESLFDSPGRGIDGNLSTRSQKPQHRSDDAIQVLDSDNEFDFDTGSNSISSSLHEDVAYSRQNSEGVTAAGSSTIYEARNTTTSTISGIALFVQEGHRENQASEGIDERGGTEGSSYDLVQQSFDAIYDGGYHEGYWKAKYSSTTPATTLR